jgi:ATP synthase protein I
MSNDNNQLESLEKRIQQAQEKPPGPPPQTTAADQAGARAAGEFVAHVIAGAVLGWGFDKLVGTMPVGIVVMTLAGFGSGLYRCNKILSQK